MDEVINNRLSPHEHIYQELIDQMLAELEKKSAATNRHLHVTDREIIQHIESYMRPNRRKICHSDNVSRSRLYHTMINSNSIMHCNKTASFTSPKNFSGTNFYPQHQQNLQKQDQSRRGQGPNKVHRYLTLSNGITYHAKSANSRKPHNMQDSATSNLLPSGSPPTELKSQATPILQVSTKIREVQIKVEDTTV